MSNVGACDDNDNRGNEGAGMNKIRRVVVEWLEGWLRDLRELWRKLRCGVNNGDVKEGSIMSETAKCGVCGAGKFGREAVAAAGGAEGDAFRRKLAEYDARVLKGHISGIEFDRPILGLKPRRVAEDERLAEVLDAMARYVRAGKAVPGEWRDELEELLAWRDASFQKLASEESIAAALARDRQAADVTEHLGADAVRRALGEGRE